MALDRVALAADGARLAELHANRTEIDTVLRETYIADAALWRKHWRPFFLATEGLSGDRNGEEWAVSHFRLRPVHVCAGLWRRIEKYAASVAADL